jgi:hypothetical protein
MIGAARKKKAQSLPADPKTEFLYLQAEGKYSQKENWIGRYIMKKTRASVQWRSQFHIGEEPS